MNGGWSKKFKEIYSTIKPRNGIETVHLPKLQPILWELIKLSTNYMKYVCILNFIMEGGTKNTLKHKTYD